MATSLENDLDLLQIVGSGAFGSVYMAKRTSDGTVLAVKTVRLQNERERNEIQKEVDIMKACSHPNLIKYYESFNKRNSSTMSWNNLDEYWICMEYCCGGSLMNIYEKIGPLTERQIAYVCKEALKGLKYLHSQNVIHRDIKGANILLADQGEVKLADFGISAKISQTVSKRNTVAGTYHWMAPEVVSPKSEGYNQKYDIWSLGITAIELAECNPPLSEYNPAEVIARISKRGYKSPALSVDKWSADFCRFVKAALTKNQEKRPTAEKLLQHKFLKRVLTKEPGMELLDLVKRTSSNPSSHSDDPLVSPNPSYQDSDNPSASSKPSNQDSNDLPASSNPPNEVSDDLSASACQVRLQFKSPLLNYVLDPQFWLQRSGSSDDEFSPEPLITFHKQADIIYSFNDDSNQSFGDDPLSFYTRFGFSQ